MSRAPRNAAGQDWQGNGGGRGGETGLQERRDAATYMPKAGRRMEPAKRGALVPNHREAVRLRTPRRDIRNANASDGAGSFGGPPKTSGDDLAGRPLARSESLSFSRQDRGRFRKTRLETSDSLARTSRRRRDNRGSRTDSGSDTRCIALHQRARSNYLIPMAAQRAIA